MKKKLASKSAFFSPRFFTGFALCSIGVFLALLVFARPSKPVEQQNNSTVQQSAPPTFVGVALPAPKQGNVRIGSNRPAEVEGVVDLAALGIHPATAPLPLRVLSSGDAGSPEGAAMGTGKAFMGISHEVVNQNTTAAFGTLSSGWIPGESVQLNVDGVPSGTFAASGDGTVALVTTTGAGFGYHTLEEIGLTSGKDTGGVVQVASTGPYLPGVTGAPHAINTTASGHFYILATHYPANTSLNIYRNGTFLGALTSSPSGFVFFTFT